MESKLGETSMQSCRCCMYIRRVHMTSADTAGGNNKPAGLRNPWEHGSTAPWKKKTHGRQAKNNNNNNKTKILRKRNGASECWFWSLKYGENLGQGFSIIFPWGHKGPKIVLRSMSGGQMIIIVLCISMYIGVDKGPSKYGLRARFGPRAAIWEGLT